MSKYCHKHGSHNCQKCADEILALGIQCDKDRIATLTAEVARLTEEIEKETAHSKHLAGAVSRKIEELIATENQCGYYRTQYSRAEQLRKEACEANVKAQAAMLWLEDALAASESNLSLMRSECVKAESKLAAKEQECERLCKTLTELVQALDSTTWSTWQTTAKFQDQLDAARKLLNGGS